MIVRNKTKNTIITNDLKVAKSFMEQHEGLLVYKQPVALLLSSRWGIHTFFMKYAIDVLILNQECKIVKMKQSMQPNRVFFWNPRYHTILEFPERTIQKSKTKINDLLSID